MGVYIYERTPKVIKAKDIYGKQVLVNEIAFAFKPFWELWQEAGYPPSPFDRDFRSASERKTLRLYRLKLTTWENREERMRERGQLSPLVVIKQDNAARIVYWDARLPMSVYDDSWMTSDRVVGELVGKKFFPNENYVKLQAEANESASVSV